jgi:quercetin dioxygenase-like cupin family protein
MIRPANCNTGSARVFSVVGDRYHFQVLGEETNGAFAMFEAFVPPQHGPPPHVHHREDEVFYVIEGEFTFTIAGQPVLATAGQTIYAKRDTPHTFKNSGGQAGRLIIIVTPAGLERFFLEVGIPLDSPESQPVEPTAADIDRLLAAAPRYGVEILVPGD